MLTATSRSEDIQQALELGALSYRVKSPSADNVTTLLAKFAVP
jgi:response regulator of citrate/malate metabolism